MYNHCIYIFNQDPHSHRVYIEKVGRLRSLKLSGVSVAKSVGCGGVVSAKGGSWDLIGVDVVILEDCSLAVL